MSEMPTKGAGNGAIRPDHLTRFQPGHKLGGRPKKLLARVDEVLHKVGFHPVEELMKLYPDLPARDKAKICLELIAYCQPKPKDDPPTEAELLALELKAKTTAELVQLVKAKLPELEAG